MATISQTTFSYKGTIMLKMRGITNVRLFIFKIAYFASSVQLMAWILLHVLAFHPSERLRWSLAWISSLPMELSPSYIFWLQLMWWVTTDVAVSICGRSGLWPFRFVAVPVCGLSVCGRSGLWPFRSVAVPVCGRSGLWPFRLWPFRFVAVMTCYRLTTTKHTKELTAYNSWNILYSKVKIILSKTTLLHDYKADIFARPRGRL